MSTEIIAHLSRVDSNMERLIGAAGELRIEIEPDCHPFQSLAGAIVYQQLHASAARAILGRFVAKFGNGSFPTPQAVLAARTRALRSVGLSFAKIAALKDLAAKSIAGIVPDRESLTLLSDDEVIERLTQVRGVGRWTVEMLLIFQLRRTDVLPVDDFGVRNGFRLAYGLRKMPTPKALRLYGARWAPHRSAAAWYLWRACDLKKAGKLPEPLGKIVLPRVPGRRRKTAKRAAKRKPARASARRTAAKRRAE